MLANKVARNKMNQLFEDIRAEEANFVTTHNETLLTSDQILITGPSLVWAPFATSHPHISQP